MTLAARQLMPYVGARDVVAQLGCSRAAAYRMLAEAAGRLPGARGMLRVPMATWERYLEERARCGGVGQRLIGDRQGADHLGANW